MQVINLKRKVYIYSEIEELPVKRYNAFNKFTFMQSQVGGDLSDINKHLAIIAQVAQDKEKLKTAIENFYQLFGFLENDINCEHLAFAVLVYKIGDEVKTDISRSGLNDLLEELNELGLTQKVLKKKLKRLAKA